MFINNTNCFDSFKLINCFQIKFISCRKINFVIKSWRIHLLSLRSHIRLGVWIHESAHVCAVLASWSSQIWNPEYLINFHKYIHFYIIKVYIFFFPAHILFFLAQWKGWQGAKNPRAWAQAPSELRAPVL